MDLGPFLRGRRERFGFSTQQVAALAGLSLEQVETAEQPGASLGLVIVHALGDALAFDPAALLRGEAIDDPRRLPGWFRSHEPMDDEAVSPKDARLFARAAELGHVGEFLWQELNRGRSILERLRAPKSVVDFEDPWREGYGLGETARLSSSAVDGPVVSMQAFIEGLGVHVARVEFDSTTREAVSVYRPGALPIILLNTNTARVRHSLSRRAVLGHELCHLLHDSGEQPLRSSDGTTTPVREVIEQRANGFAPAFLAPPGWLRRDFEPVTSDDLEAVHELVLTLASTWGFTGVGAVWHAKNCELIPKSSAERLAHDPLVAELNPRGHGFEPERPSALTRRADADEIGVTSLCAGLIEDLVVEALDGGAITANRAREILSWS
ncbi:hypothetical protein ENSA5_01170 [Enhygromyxa salina]|uniref:IrrE N-terminal-like domain-containing protein n=1 Tax=Enhygromyxa salina TaxID=215803 RepID=A0A2S9YL06_9BACT|nr:XRE family transcriptional regulator [Enhygromyxa salina]PRQ05797.1 hypothetical protein ENSA5_01170 [Enhygromyxa salina]